MAEKESLILQGEEARIRLSLFPYQKGEEKRTKVQLEPEECSWGRGLLTPQGTEEGMICPHACLDDTRMLSQIWSSTFSVKENCHLRSSHK